MLLDLGSFLPSLPSRVEERPGELAGDPEKKEYILPIAYVACSLTPTRYRRSQHP